MSDDFGLLYSTFWTGRTGRQLQAKGKDAVILGAYVASTRHANLIGLYQLPIAYIEADLAVLGGGAIIRDAFAALADVGFAFRDETTEAIWVVEMARIRLALPHGSVLKTSDKRHRFLVRLYQNTIENCYLDAFFDRYERQLSLGERRVPKVTQRQIGGPSEGPGGGMGGGSLRSTPEYTGSGVSTATAETRRSKDPHPRTADQNIEVITRLVAAEVLPLGLPDGDLVEVTKSQCAQRHIAYSGSVVRKAIDSALVRAQGRRQES